MTILSYDRAGLMYSEARQAELTVDAVTTDLRWILEKTNPPRPYIFVGHSYGGVLIRHFAHRFPDLVDGFVFVECLQSEHLKRLPILHAIARKKAWLLKTARAARTKPQLAELCFKAARPLIWLAANLKYLKYTTRHGPEIVEAVLAQPRATLCATADEFATIQHFLSSLPGKLPRPEVPISVVASNQSIAKRQFPGADARAIARYTAIHRTLQRDLTQLSDRAEFTLDSESSHNVPIDNPELLVREILKLASKI